MVIDFKDIIIITYRNHTSTFTHTIIAVTLALPHSLSILTPHTNNSTRITIAATTSLTIQGTKKPHRQIKDDYITTHTTESHRPRSKSERNIIILQVNINEIRNKLEELKRFIHNTHADVLTIQEAKLTPEAKASKVYKFTTVRTDRSHKSVGGLITLVRCNITFTTQTYHRPLIHTSHNFKWPWNILATLNTSLLQTFICFLETVHERTTKHLRHTIMYTAYHNIPHSALTGDVDAHSTLRHSYSDDHGGLLIADVISNPKHITLNTDTPTECETPHYNTHLHQKLPRCLTQFTTGRRG